MSDFLKKNTFLSDEELEEDFETNEAEEIVLKRLSDLSKQGYLLMKEGNLLEAEKCFTEIIEKDKLNNYALVGLGDIERRKRHFKKAIKYYQNCLEIHPSNNYALFGLADCFKALRKYSKAIQIWEEYILNDDTNVTVLNKDCRFL